MRNLSFDRVSAGAVAMIVAAGGLYAAIAALAGPPPATRFPGDDFLWFDGAVRILQGQRPHADFYTPLGALYFQVPAWIMSVTGRSVAAFAGAVAVFGTVGALFAWAACRARMAPPFALALAAMSAVFLLSLRAYGYEFHALGFAAYYNKLGVVLLAAAMVPAFVSRDDGGADRARIALLAVALALGFYLKVTFFLLIAVVVVAGEAARNYRAPLRGALAVAAVLACAATLIAAYALLAGVPLGACLADIGLAATAKASVWAVFPRILYVVWPPEFLLYLLVPTVTAALVIPAGKDAALIRHGAMLATGLAIAAVLPIVNSQGTEAFFPCALAFVLAGTAWRQRAPTPWPGTAAGVAHHALRAVQFATGALAVTLPNLGGEIYGRAVPLPGLQGTGMIVTVPVAGAAPWRFYPHRSKPEEAAYARALAAGAVALRPLASTGTTIATLDFSNPFPFLLGARAPAGGAAWWHIGINLNAAVAAKLGSPVAGACLVMEPKHPYMPETRDFLRAWAAPALARDFTTIRDDADWRIWRARAGCPAPPA